MGIVSCVPGMYVVSRNNDRLLLLVSCRGRLLAGYSLAYLEWFSVPQAYQTDRAVIPWQENRIQVVRSTTFMS